MAGPSHATMDLPSVRAEPLGARSPTVILVAVVVLFALVYWTTGGMTQMALDAAVLFVFPVVLVWWVGQTDRGSRLLRTALIPLDRFPPESRSAWPWCGFATVCLAVVILESSQPLYFTQDDSLANGVVGMVVGSRSLFSGVFPLWNHCQYLGSPMASMSYWSLTYPPTYLSYLMATYVLGNSWWTMEVYQVAHLLLSFAAIYCAARAVGLRTATATMAAVAVSLSGSSLVMGRSWYATIPLNVWLPLLVIGISQLWRGSVSWRWIVVNGAIMGVLFHVGYPQTWVYAMIAFLGCGALLWMFGEIPFRRALRVIPAQMLGVAIASPLLVVLLLETRGSQLQPYGRGIDLSGMLAMVLPYPLVSAGHPERWGSDQLETMGQMYYWGTLLPLLALVGVASFMALRHRRQTLVGNYWLLVAAFWLAVTLGYKAVVWVLMSFLPGFSNFSCPFKAQQFFNLFAALGAGLMLDRLLARRIDRVRWERLLTLSVLVLMAYHCGMARTSFYNYGFAPYPELPSAFETVNKSQQRVLVVAPKRSMDPTFPLSLQLNSATAYGIPVVAGYDPLVEFAATTKQILANVSTLEDGWERYGVRWVVVHHTAKNPQFSENEAMRWQEELDSETLDRIGRQLRAKRATIFYEAPEVTIYELPEADPMAFATHDALPLPIQTDHGGLRVDTSGLTVPSSANASVTVNYASRPFMSAVADGQRVEIEPDAYLRMRVDVPTGCQQLSIRYRPPWGLGLGVGLVLVVGALAFDVVSQRRVMSRPS